MINWEEILDEFAHKCGDGGPDMTNPNHLALLRNKSHKRQSKLDSILPLDKELTMPVSKRSIKILVSA